uniref:Polyketide synthase n=1 Tax=Pestalotiopsis microspora TaxID=85828 RepID=A0A1P8NTJ1_PESMI|nr:polyketide synthase [Pestalotiopsis microspora]
MYKRPSSEPIAIIGSSCRFAGNATSPSRLWQVLASPPDLSKEVPAARFNARAFYHEDGEHLGTTNSIKAYWLEQDHRVFDAGFFNITPKEAEAIDPQQRILLEVVYEAMESSGITLHQYSGENVGVFAGVMTADYDTLSQRDELSASQYYATGNARSIISNRISYFFNFRGPSMTIDTACSSSLVALHQAVLSLRSGEVPMACVTGVNLMITPEQFLVESSLHMLSPTGKSRMWDHGADGYARGEGIAAILIKPLSRALHDGDEILGLIRQTGVNSDGRTPGITMPNPSAQESLIRSTYLTSGLDPQCPEDRCQYFEAHGTGTQAGDPREAQAIHDAFFGSSTDTRSDTKMLVGSIKTVIGHTEGAAGLAGVLKVLQAMKHAQVPPNLHLDSLNPTVRPFYKYLEIPTSLVAWPKTPEGHPLRASVNSFGFGGTNSHAIIESYNPQIHGAADTASLVDPLRPYALQDPNIDGQSITSTQFHLPLLLSASSKKSLLEVTRTWRNYLAGIKDNMVPRLCLNLFRYRTALPYRLSISANSKEQALELLDAALNREHGTLEFGNRSKTLTHGPRILGIFTGQGAQWSSMSRTLLQTNARYRETIQELDRVLQQCPDPPSWTLEHQIIADEPQSRTHEAQISQPLCTAVQIGLVNVLQDLGVELRAVVGHSSGEIAAAYAAKMLSARDAMLISYYRGLYAHLARGTNGERGAMMAVGMSATEAVQFCRDPLFEGKICVAASNAPLSVTLSGDVHMIQNAKNILTEQSRFARVLQVDTAYHSSHMMRPAQAYINALAKCNISPLPGSPGVSWISSVYGYGEGTDKDLASIYWRDNMVESVQFCSAVTTAISDLGSFDCAVEVGPHPALKGPVTQTIKELLGTPVPYYGLLERSKDDGLAFCEFLGSMWCQFGPRSADIAQYVHQLTAPSLVDDRLRDLPSYRWDHTQTHYRESRISRQYHFKHSAPHELLGVRTRDDNAFELRWRNILRPGKLPWLQGHCFQGQALVPASAYCVMALDAAIQLLDGRCASVIELRDVDIVSGISMESDSLGTELLFSLKVSDQHKERGDKNIITASFTLASCSEDGNASMKKNASGNIIIILEDMAADALPFRQESLSETLPASTDAFYKMMDDTGLVYSGPFRAIQSIKRRCDFASTTLLRRHPEDTTELALSPATLDSCLQSAFLTYSSPGDKSLWTSFLPTRIARIQFNVAQLGRNSNKKASDLLTVDSHLTEVRGSTTNSKATFTVEIGIYNTDNEMEVEIEGLTVAAFANTRPEDDHELYLHTVMDIDPTDEIVSPDENPNMFIPEVTELCEKISSLYLTDGGQVLLAPAPSSNATASGIEEKDNVHSRNQVSHDFAAGTTSFDSCEKSLSFLHEIGRSVPALLPSAVPVLVQEAALQLRHTQHLERVVKQISHKYPRMNVLNIAGNGLDLSGPILGGLGSSYLSFTNGFAGEKRKALDMTVHKTSTTGPQHWLDMTVDILHQLESATLLDLVAVDMSVLAHGSPRSSLKNIRTSMRDDAFLLLVQFDECPLRRKFYHAVQPSSAVQTKFEPQDHRDLLNECGFSSVARNSDQIIAAGFSIHIYQASATVDTRGQTLPDLSVPPKEKVLIIGPNSDMSSVSGHALQRNLIRKSRSVELVESIERIETSQLSAYTSAIVLEDLEHPVMSSMTERKLSVLKELLRPNMTILWLTRNTRFGNPEHASTLGFTRTVSAEVPNLRLQVLDLEDNMDFEDVILRTFVDLIKPVPDTGRNLWIQEPEIYMDQGHRLVARVLPLKESNDRANAIRRVVSRPVNTINEVIRIRARFPEDGGIHHAIQRLEPAPKGSRVKDWTTLRVLYSTMEAVKSDHDTFAHICIGRDLETGALKLALSTTNASYIEIPMDLTQVLPRISLAMPQFLHCLARYHISMTIFRSQVRTASGCIIVVDADPLLIRCAKVVAQSEGVEFIAWTTSSSPIPANNHCIRIHERSSDRKLRALIPPSGATIYDFSSGSDFSERLVNLLPNNCDYYFGASILTSHWMSQRPGRDHNLSSSMEAFNHAVTLTLGDTENFHEGLIETLSTSEVIKEKGVKSTVNIIDWTAERTTQEIVEPLIEQNLLNARKTYVLVGLTRDFGQSLTRLFIEHGARHVVLASRNPGMAPGWKEELRQAFGVHIVIEKLDVTSLEDVARFRRKIEETMPEVGGVINGAMVLDDRVFSQMTVETWNRVLHPKTVGSRNLDTVFSDLNLEFFIMTSSFAAIGGHPGQCNYAAANMYMNGLAANRRQRGLAGSVLNIGVIYGLGLLQREKEELYIGLEREGYPPISERDIHHMFLEAIVAGRPGTSEPFDITTGLRRFKWGSPNPLHWHQDPRFSHFTVDEGASDLTTETGAQGSLLEQLSSIEDIESVTDCLVDAFTSHLKVMLQLPEGSISRQSSLSEIGIDSLVAVDIRSWIWKTLGRDVAVLKILGSSSIDRFCLDIAEQISAENYTNHEPSTADTPSTPRTTDEASLSSSPGASTATTGQRPNSTDTYDGRK